MSDVRFEFQCRVCDEPVADGTGHLQVSKADMRKARETQRVYDAKRAQAPGGCLPVDALMGLHFAPWHALHLACDPTGESDFYAFPIDQIRTPLDALGWASHLAYKGWVDKTDWPSFLGAIVDQGNRLAAA